MGERGQLPAAPGPLLLPSLPALRPLRCAVKDRVPGAFPPWERAETGSPALEHLARPMGKSHHSRVVLLRSLPSRSPGSPPSLDSIPQPHPPFREAGLPGHGYAGREEAALREAEGDPGHQKTEQHTGKGSPQGSAL